VPRLPPLGPCDLKRLRPAAAARARCSLRCHLSSTPFPRGAPTEDRARSRRVPRTLITGNLGVMGWRSAPASGVRMVPCDHAVGPTSTRGAISARHDASAASPECSALSERGSREAFSPAGRTGTVPRDQRSRSRPLPGHRIRGHQGATAAEPTHERARVQRDLCTRSPRGPGPKRRHSRAPFPARIAAA
jgi:hypothetical protein